MKALGLLVLFVSSIGFAKTLNFHCENSLGIAADITMKSAEKLVVHTNWDGKKKSNAVQTLRFEKDAKHLQPQNGVSFSSYDNPDYLFEVKLPKRAVSGTARSAFHAEFISRFDGLSPIRSQTLSCTQE